jgi:hypothetical protein
VHERLRSIEKTLTGILGASLQTGRTADADDSAFFQGLEGESLGFLSFAHSLEEAGVVPSLPLSSAHGPEGRSPSSVQDKETPSESPKDQTPSDSAGRAVDVVNTSGRQASHGDDIRVLFSALLEILQHHLMDAATVAEALLKDCDVRIATVVALVAAIFCYILYCVYYTLRYGIVFAH